MNIIADCIEPFRASLALEQGLSQRTVEAYSRDVAAFSKFLSGRGKTFVEKVVRNDITDYLAQLRAMNRRPSSRARAFAAIRHFFRHLKESRVLKTDITESLDAPKRGRILPRVLTEETTSRLMASADGTEPRDIRDRAILELLYGSGLRVSELCALDIGDIPDGADVVLCRGKGSKERLVPLGGASALALRRYLESARETLVRGNASERHLFVTRLGRGFTRMGIFKMLRERATTAGVDPTAVSPHVLRHCFASHLLAHGADIRAIQEMLGHASIATTQIYTHVDKARLSAIHKTYHPRAE